MSGTLSTTDLKVGGSGIPKTLEPGNHACTITSVLLEEFSYVPGSYNVILNLEGPDMGPEFEGFFIDKDNEKLGRHKGKVAKLKLTQWAFADGTTKSGVAVSRDTEMLKALKQLCINIGCADWLPTQEGKHQTIESFYAAFNKEAPFKGKVINFCIAGKEYTNKAGYPAFELFLPKYSKEGVNVELAGVTPSKLIKFSEEKHIEKKKSEPVDEFAVPPTENVNMSTPDGGIVTNTDNDFNL